MRRIFVRFAALALLAAVLSKQAIAQSFTESFDDITQLAASGWVMTNASVPVGSTGWMQGNPSSSGGPFDSYTGAANAYVAANYNNTGNTGTISNWLMMPNRTLRNGDVLTFYTRKASPDNYADRLEVRLSGNGASTSVGSGTAVGDFDRLLLSINPSLTLGVYPTSWTLYTVTVSGLPAPTSGRLAFRYFVTSGGLNGTNSDYIGIDDVGYTAYTCPALTLPAGGALTGGVFAQPYEKTLTQTGALGAPSFAVTAGALPPGLIMSAAGVISGAPTATGTFNFTATVSDASGCSGFQSYSITVLPGVPTAPQNVSATPGNMVAEVSWQAPADDGGAPVIGYTATAVQDPSKWCSTTGALSCTVAGLTNGSGYSFSVVATNIQGPSPAATSGMVTPTQGTVSGPVPGMSGVATAAITAGGAGCTFDAGARFFTPATAPVHRTLPYGAFEFGATGCSGSVTVAITYPEPLPDAVQFWKFGPATAGASTSKWFPWSDATLSPDRRTVTYTVVDNGVGDSDNTLGHIQDPFALALGGDPTSVPVDNPWALGALAFVLGWLGMRRQQLFRKG